MPLVLALKIFKLVTDYSQIIRFAMIMQSIQGESIMRLKKEINAKGVEGEGADNEMPHKTFAMEDNWLLKVPAFV